MSSQLKNRPLPKKNQQYFLRFYETEEFEASHINIVCKLSCCEEAAAVHGDALTKQVNQVIDLLVSQYDNFRMVFPISNDADNSRVVDILDEALTPLLSVESSQIERDEEWARYVKDSASKLYLCRFNLEQGPLFRFHLIQRSAKSSALIMTFHHAIMDFWSLILIQKFFAKHLASSVVSSANRVGKLPQPYIDDIKLEHAMLDSPEFESRKQFWRNYLTTKLQSKAQLASDLPNEIESECTAIASRMLGSETLVDSVCIPELGRSDFSPYLSAHPGLRLDQRDLVFAAYLIALKQHVPSFNQVVLVSVANRSPANAKSIGCYSNALPVNVSNIKEYSINEKSKLTAQSVMAFTALLKAEVIRCTDQYLPLSSIIKEANPDLYRSMSDESLDRWPSTHQFNPALSIAGGSNTETGTTIDYWPEVGAGRANREFGTELFISLIEPEMWLIGLTYNQHELAAKRATAVLKTVKDIVSLNGSENPSPKKIQS